MLMRLFKKKEIEKAIKLPHKSQLITALIQIGDECAEVVGKCDPDDPTCIQHEWDTPTGYGKSKIISWKPIDSITPKVIKSLVQQDEALQETIRQCLNLCSTAGVQCDQCKRAIPHHHFYFAKSGSARGFDVVSYPTLNIAIYQYFLENNDEYFIDWVTADYLGG
jgi:hypothetical protein